MTILLLSSNAAAKSKTLWLPIFNDGLTILVPFNSTPYISSPIKKTGQKISYDDVGNVISNGSVKDDGYYQKGITPSYSRNLGVVTDHIIGLQWSDTENVGFDSWDEAGNYCKELILNGKGWRLPTIIELNSIILPSVYHPAIDTTAFQNYNSGTYGDYWTSSVGTGNTDKMWRLHLYGGSMNPTYKYNGGYSRCIRSQNLRLLANFSRLSDVVIDNNTGLQWQDTKVVYKGKWLPAINYCEGLELNGKGWRLPNINELKSIIDYSRIGPSINSIFKNAIYNNFWSSTTAPWATDSTLVIDFWLGELRSNDKTFYDTNLARCVR